MQSQTASIVVPLWQDVSLPFTTEAFWSSANQCPFQEVLARVLHQAQGQSKDAFYIFLLYKLLAARCFLTSQAHPKMNRVDGEIGMHFNLSA